MLFCHATGFQRTIFLQKFVCELVLNALIGIHDLFTQLAKGKTVLMIAHRLSTVANADCIYVVQDGKIEESGTKDELCAQNGLFARMWQEYQASVQRKVAKEG